MVIITTTILTATGLVCLLFSSRFRGFFFFSRVIPQHLLELLDRDNVEFLVLVVKFLKKLSIFVENKDEMAQADVLQKLARLVQV